MSGWRTSKEYGILYLYLFHVTPLRWNSWTAFLVEVSGHKLETSQTQVFVWFSSPNISVLQMLFINRFVMSCFADFFVRILKPERVCTVLFFGAEIQPKHLVFCYLGFLPGFLLVFCCLPYPMHSRFQENQAFLFWRIFFLGFWNPSNCLVFLELFTFWNKDQIEILLFI